MSETIKVLIVDDSALIRQLLTTILESDPSIEVVGSAPDPLKARQMIKKLNPDVLTLDIEMPKMNGIEFLKKIMTLRPMPVVMISSLTQNGADISLQALEIGAVDVIGKPQSDLQRKFVEQSKEIIEKVKVAASAKVHAYDNEEFAKPTANVKSNIDVDAELNKKMIAIGASTGGVEALRIVLSSLPPQMPPIFVVQHMPKQFTGPFAKRLNSMSHMTVVEAEDGMVAQDGHVYVSPGDEHLRVVEKSGKLICDVKDGDVVNGHIPSVSVLFDSVLAIDPAATIGVMLSGMGKDGASSMKELKDHGAYNIAQNEKTCVVYGMPKAASDLGAVNLVCDLKKIPDALISLCIE